MLKVIYLHSNYNKMKTNLLLSMPGGGESMVIIVIIMVILIPILIFLFGYKMGIKKGENNILKNK